MSAREFHSRGENQIYVFTGELNSQNNSLAPSSPTMQRFKIFKHRKNNRKVFRPLPLSQWWRRGFACIKVTKRLHRKLFDTYNCISCHLQSIPVCRCICKTRWCYYTQHLHHICGCCLHIHLNLKPNKNRKYEKIWRVVQYRQTDTV